MPESRPVDQEVTLYYSPKGKSEWFKRNCQPEGWSLDDGAAKELAAKRKAEEEAARQKEIDAAVEAELARRDSQQKESTEQEAAETEGHPEAASNLSEDEEKELADLQDQIDELDKQDSIK